MLKKILLTLAAIFIVGVVAFVIIFLNEIKQLNHVNRLFDEGRIVHNFTHMDAIFPIVKIENSGDIYEFDYDIVSLPDSFYYNSQPQSITNWIEETRTKALLVIRDSTIVFEDYYMGTNEWDKRISWSMSKSFLSALFGIAVHDGYIPDLDVPVTDYVPGLIGTGYEGITIKNVLQMSSGIQFNENYGEFGSDINRFGRAIALGSSFDEFAASLKTDPTREQGTYLHYVSIDTHVIGMVLRAATGKTIKELFEENLWSKVGFERDAYFISDGNYEPMVLGGLNMITRDYARMAILMRNFGNLGDTQIIPKEWVLESITPDKPHLMPGERETATTIFGYGYQWWIPEPIDDETIEFMAIGIYGQYMYINPTLGIVIVKNSTDLDFETNNFENDVIAYHAFRAIAQHVILEEQPEISID